MYPAVFFSVARHKLRTLRILPDVNKPSQMEKVFRVLEMGELWIKNSGGVRWGPDPGALTLGEFLGQNGWRIYQKGSLAQGKVKDILLPNPAFQMGRRGSFVAKHVVKIVF